MTSAAVHTIPITSIWVNRNKRQRRELSDLDGLAASIQAVGLINFPVVTREYELITGERRWTACKDFLHWTEMPVHFTDEIDPAQLHLLELEENVRRVDLTWQEHNRAILEYHELRHSTDPEWTQEKTASALNVDPSFVSKHLAIAAAAEIAPELNIYAADLYSTARGLAQRALERRKSTGMEELLGNPTPAAPTIQKIETLDGEDITPEPEAPAKRGGLILNIEFQDFIQTNTQYRFNFLHCDFPYGVNTGSKTSGQSATKRLGHYDDSEDVYWKLLDFLVANQSRFLESQAHLMFWCSMNFYSQTIEILEDAGWSIDPFPLIWGKSDNSGIIPDSNRGPRRGYEPCLFGSLGDRKIVRPVSNYISCPNPREVHAHQKPQEALRHFMRMFVDGSTRMLDPTCGSGSAIKAAVALGATQAVGLERDPEFAARAKAFVAAED